MNTLSDIGIRRFADGMGTSGCPREAARRAQRCYRRCYYTPGNRIDVMQNGDGTFPRLWEDLRSAQLSITLHSQHAFG